MGLKDFNESIKIIRELAAKAGAAIRKMNRDRLNTLEVALEQAIPSLEAFDKAVRGGSQIEIDSQSAKTADKLSTLVERLDDESLDTTELSILEAGTRQAPLWKEYFPQNKEKVERLAPEWIENLKTMHAQVQKRLAELA